MYYRYKSRRRNKNIYNITAVLLLAVLLGYGVYRYRHYLFFWRYSMSRLEERIDSAAAIADRTAREARLRDLVKMCGDFADDNMLSGDAHAMLGRAHFNLAECLAGRSFSEKIVYEGFPWVLRDEERREYTEALRCFRKAAALSGPDNASPSSRFMFARAAFSTGYYSPGDIFTMLGRGIQVERADDPENMRFYALLHVLNGREDEGIKLLQVRGKTSDTIEGQLYSAALQCIAKRYTNSIMEYKNILVRTTSGEVLKLVHINLGRIYYTQSLYNESLIHFENALSIDRDDVQSKIWMGKNYSAMGNKLKARAIWSEVLAADASNEEVRRLLKLM